MLQRLAIRTLKFYSNGSTSPKPQAIQQEILQVWSWSVNNMYPGSLGASNLCTDQLGRPRMHSFQILLASPTILLLPAERPSYQRNRSRIRCAGSRELRKLPVRGSDPPRESRIEDVRSEGLKKMRNTASQ